MAVTYNASLKNSRMDDVLAAIDADASAGTLEIGDSGFASTLVTITLNDPAGTVSTDTLTFDVTGLSNTAAASGTAAEARIKDGAGTVVVSGLTVGTSGTDIVVNSTSVTSGQSVTVDSMSIQHS